MQRNCLVNFHHKHTRSLQPKATIMAVVLLLLGTVVHAQTGDALKKKPAGDSKQSKSVKKTDDPCDAPTDYYVTGMISTNHFYWESDYYYEDWHVFPNGDENHPPVNPGEYCQDGDEVFTDFADCAAFRTMYPNSQVFETDQYVWSVICLRSKGQAGTTATGSKEVKQRVVYDAALRELIKNRSRIPARRPAAAPAGK